RGHGAAAEASLDEVDVVAAEAGVRRAQEREEVCPRAPEQREPEQRQERVAERGLAQARPALERVRDPEPPEDRVEGRAPPAERRADNADRLRRVPAADELEDLV